MAVQLDNVIQYLVDCSTGPRRGWARATVKTYAAEFRQFARWARQHGYPFMPTDQNTVSRYLAARVTTRTNRGKGPQLATLRRAVTAIKMAHRMRGMPCTLDTLEIRGILGGYRVIHGDFFASAEAITVDDLHNLVAPLDDNPTELRDRALLTLGFGAALRPMDLAALQWQQVTFVNDTGLLLILDNGLVMVPMATSAVLCAPTAMQDLARHVFDYFGTLTGPVFRCVSKSGRYFLPRGLTAKTVNTIVMRRTEAVGIMTPYSGSSLRLGWSVTANGAGRPLASVLMHMRETGHALTRLSGPLPPWSAHPSCGLF